MRAINEIVISQNNPYDKLQLCLGRIIDALRAERGFISLYDSNEGKLNVFAIHNLNEVELFIGEAISQSIINMAYRYGKPVIVFNALEDPRFSDIASVVLSELRSVFCVSVINVKGIVGLIYFDNRLEVSAYEQDHL